MAKVKPYKELVAVTLQRLKDTAFSPRPAGE